jgi:hypothetical protein
VHLFSPPHRLLERYDVYPVCSGRGCTYACSFCAAGALSGRAYRTRTPGHVIEEMRYVAAAFDVDHFFIVDDTFTAIPERAYEICSLIEEHLPRIRWVCECRTNSVLNGVLKGTTLQQIEVAVEAAYEAGIPEVVGSFIIGLPGDTYASALETIGFALRLKAKSEAPVPRQPHPLPAGGVHRARRAARHYHPPPGSPRLHQRRDPHPSPGVERQGGTRTGDAGRVGAAELASAGSEVRRRVDGAGGAGLGGGSPRTERAR